MRKYSGTEKLRKDQCPSCGDPCIYADRPEEGPCEGQVEVVDEVDLGDGDWGWIHTCKKHKYDPFLKEPNPIKKENT